MGSRELIRFESPSALAQAAAEEWLTGLQAVANQESSYSVALSGGRIAKQFFEAIAGQSKSRAIPLSRVHFFWADERCVPPTDLESNFALARECLFEPLQIPPHQIHRIRGEIEPGEAADEAAKELRRIVRPESAGEPVFDMVFLGLGEDGHVASLFPNLPAKTVDSREVYAAVVGPKPPPERITLTYAAIAAAREVWVLASGPGKSDALPASLESASRTPLGRVLDLRTSTKILSDIPLPGGG